MTLLAKLVKQHHRGEIEKVKLQMLRRFREPCIIIIQILNHGGRYSKKDLLGGGSARVTCLDLR